MYLSTLILINYRSCKFIDVQFSRDEPNVFIGVNDCGKSTLLKGIGLLLDERPSFNFGKDNSKRDISNSPLKKEILNERLTELSLPQIPYNENEVIVIGKFTLEEGDLKLDVESFNNHSLWAIENSEHGLWYAKVYNTETFSSKAYILVTDSVDENSGELQEFYKLTDAKLQKKRTELKLTATDIENENGKGRYTKLEIIRALYNKISTSYFWSEYKTEKDFFPNFRYLDWNSSFDQILGSATEALASLIEGYISPIKIAAAEKAEEAERAVNEKLNEIKDVIASILPQVTNLKAKIQFDVKEKITDLIINKLHADGDIHIDLQGDGVKRQIWFAIVKATAQSTLSASSRKKHIWAFDEPETHLYPTAQRQLFEIIKEVSLTNIQSAISTHSTVFIDKANLEAISIVNQGEDGYSEHKNCTAIDDIFESLELRNSDFLFYDKFLIVEGETERDLIPGLYKLFSGSSLKDDNIQLVVLQGASKWLDQKKAFESVFHGFKKNDAQVFYLFDSDQKYSLGQKQRSPNMFFVGRQDIEDAIPTNVWVKVIHELSNGEEVIAPKRIDEIRDSINDKKALLSHEKFLPLLNKELTAFRKILDNDADGDLIPRKGKDLAEKLLTHIAGADIPAQIQLCFASLKNNTHHPSETAKPEKVEI